MGFLSTIFKKGDKPAGMVPEKRVGTMEEEKEMLEDEQEGDIFGRKFHMKSERFIREAAKMKVELSSGRELSRREKENLLKQMFGEDKEKHGSDFTPRERDKLIRDMDKEKDQAKRHNDLDRAEELERQIAILEKSKETKIF